ncbi:Zn-ribbon domain-containing OB-fold protein [Chloroflexota bacterium]
MNDSGSKSREKQRIPIEPGLFTMPSSPSESPHLIGGKCLSCGAVFFPKQDLCISCSSAQVEEVLLSTKGKVYSSTISMLPPPLYEGPVPYVVGYVELSEGVLVPALFAQCSLEKPPEIGTEMEMFVEKWKEDEEGNEVLIYRFRPAGS